MQSLSRCYDAGPCNKAGDSDQCFGALGRYNFDHRVKCLRSDNGGEFTSKEFEETRDERRPAQTSAERHRGTHGTNAAGDGKPGRSQRSAGVSGPSSTSDNSRSTPVMGVEGLDEVGSQGDSISNARMFSVIIRLQCHDTTNDDKITFASARYK